jgi:hypothetical protein
MTHIFLKLVERGVSGELIPDTLVPVFVKFKTSYGEGGGLTILTLESEEKRVGNATIRWPKAEGRRPLAAKRKHWVGTGTLQEINLPSHFTDEDRARLILEAMARNRWIVNRYDPGKLEELIDASFEAWIDKNL